MTCVDIELTAPGACTAEWKDLTPEKAKAVICNMLDFHGEEAIAATFIIDIHRKDACPNTQPK